MITSSDSDTDILTVFPSRLGWMALIGCGDVLKQLTFGHSSAKRAAASLRSGAVQEVRKGRWNEVLIERLQAYAEGAYDDFLDVPVDLSRFTPFQRRVLERARRIPLGATMSYGQLAAAVGAPGAARAVGQSMAANPIPLIIPCHRVISASGSLCGFSALGGVRTKQRILQMEAHLVSCKEATQVSAR